MPQGYFKTIAEQVADHLKAELGRRRWTGTMPGKHQLASELGVNNKTVEAALRQLEQEGILAGQGAGKRRLIKSSAKRKGDVEYRVALFLLDKMDRSDHYITELWHTLEEAGHIPFYPDKCSSEFSDKPEKLARFVKKTEADTWIIVAGSRRVLEWFSSHDVAAFALFGRRSGLPISATGPDKASALLAATNRLIELGHRRICLLCREQRRVPSAGKSERAFLRCLESAGIVTGPFNLPDWEENQDAFIAMLESLFETTPPTALIVDEAFLYNATFSFVAHRGLRVPDDVSLACTDNDPHFAWCQPSVSHISWDYRLTLNRVTRWINNLGSGSQNKRQTLTKAEFIEGGTIGPAPQ